MDTLHGRHAVTAKAAVVKLLDVYLLTDGWTQWAIPVIGYVFFCFVNVFSRFLSQLTYFAFLSLRPLSSIFKV